MKNTRVSHGKYSPQKYIRETSTVLKRISRLFHSETSSGEINTHQLLSGQSLAHAVVIQKCGSSDRFDKLMEADSVDMPKLRELVWSGCSRSDPRTRSYCWQLLLGFLPPRIDRRSDSQARKALEYDGILSEYERSLADDLGKLRDDSTRSLIRQVDVDIPRTVNFGLDWILSRPFDCIIRRVLIVWSLRNPACGYVQGMNDIMVTIMLVLIEGSLNRPLESIKADDFVLIDARLLESDLYWMFSRLIQGVQDHYTSSQPGIQKMMRHFKDIIRRLDQDLSNHLESQQIDLEQLSFRWFNCLLAREFGYRSLLRIWDTCIAEEDGFNVFLVYFCAVLIRNKSAKLRCMEFQQIMSFFTPSDKPIDLPDINELEANISEAFVLKTLFHSSPNHLMNSS